MKKEIYFAGGCFWGVQKYFEQVYGVINTIVGYANGKGDSPCYEDVCNGNGFVETVKVIYSDDALSVTDLVFLYFKIIDPFSENKQGNDEGIQYRTGIYYTDKKEFDEIFKTVNNIIGKDMCKLKVEIMPLKNFFVAERYHQYYLYKNNNGYCHINNSLFEQAKSYLSDKAKQKKSELIEKLTPLSYNVTQNAVTETPYNNPYANKYEKGIYADVITGEPLFLSSDKLNGNYPHPSFSKPISYTSIIFKPDKDCSMERVEVKSSGGSHLGYVYMDGDAEYGGVRFCINSAALKFVSYNHMETEGYGNYMHDL